MSEGNAMLPFMKDPLIPAMGLVFTFIFLALVMVGSTNAVNLTDGLDGLAIGCSNSVAVAYLAMAYVAGHMKFAQYLQVPYIAGSGELAVVGVAQFAVAEHLVGLLHLFAPLQQ